MAVTPANLSRLKDNGALPVRLVYDVSGTTGDVVLELPDWPNRTIEIVDVHFVSTNTTAGAITIKGNLGNISDAMSKSGTLNVIGRAGAILHANSIVTGRKALKAGIASAGTVAARIFIDAVLHWKT